MQIDSFWLMLALGAAVAGFVQGLSGFAFSMVAMSFWAWTLEPHLAAAMAVFGGLSGQLLAAFTVRRKIDLKVLLPFLAGGLAGIPLGTWLLPHLDAQVFKATLGTFLILWCPLMLFYERMPPITRGGRFADALVGAVGGILGGLGGFTGAVPSLWCTLRGFDKDTQRTVIQNFNLAALAVTMAAYIASGVVTSSMLPMFGVVAVAMTIPVLLGTRVYIGISGAAFRRIVLALLTASGLAMLLSSVPALLARHS